LMAEGSSGRGGGGGAPKHQYIASGMKKKNEKNPINM